MAHSTSVTVRSWIAARVTDQFIAESPKCTTTLSMAGAAASPVDRPAPRRRTAEECVATTVTSAKCSC
eukprot:3627277-Alexandrium_andersonii.AAC.1